MRKLFFFFVMMLVSGILYSQDTIFFKSGEIIPAVIVEKNNTEIKYKKFGQPEPAAVYSIFIIDLKSIHYSDGIIADYTLPGVTDQKPRTALDHAGKMGVVKLSFGMNATYFDRNAEDDLLKFWEYRTGLTNTAIGSNPVYYPIEIRMNMVLGQARRSWIGTGLELIFTPRDAIFVTANDGSDEVKLGMWYYNIPLYYGHTVNRKKSLIAIFEPSVDFGFMSGYIMDNNVKYELNANMGVGMKFAGGLDWIMSKRFLANVRFGYKYATVKESHKDEDSSTGYSNFYVNPTINKDLLSVTWNGPFVSAGLAWSLYFKMKGFQLE